jgi:hypothetical protein
MIKIGGNWHKIDIWEKENCIIAYKSGGLIFISLLDFKEVRYVPFYNFNDFYIDKDNLYVMDKYSNLFVVTNINSPLKQMNGNKAFAIQKCSLSYLDSLNNLEDVRAFDITDKYIICAYKQKGIDVFDKYKKDKILHYDFPGYSFVDDIKYYNNKIYIADVFGLRVLDVSNINNPILDNSHIFKGWPKDIAVANNYIFVADVLGVKIFNKSDNFCMVGKFETNKNRIAKIAIKNNLVFMACEARGLRILDISNLQKPKLISGLLLHKGVWDLFVYNNYVYMAAYTDGLYKVDYSDLKLLRTVSKYIDSKEIIGVYVDNHAVFAASSYEGVVILDHYLELISEIKISNGRAWTALRYKDFLLVACGKGGVLIYNVLNLYNPKFIIKIKTTEARDLIVRKDTLYIADGQNGVEIYDIQNIVNPKHLYNIPSAAFTRGIMVDDTYIYKADGDGGVEIYERNF